MQLRYCRVLCFLLFILTARSASAQLVPDPDPLNFGTVILTEFKDLELTINNPTSGDIFVSNFYFFGGNARDNEFTILTPTNRFFNVPAGGSQKVQIRFAPDFEGIRSRTMVFETSGDTLRLTVSGMGLLTNPILTLSTSDISFGKVSVTGQKQALVEVTNVGEDDAKVSDVNVANFSGTEHFKALPDDPSKPFPVILKQGERMTLRVLFEGAEPIGFKTGTITLVGSVGGQTIINVNGEVVEADIRVTPDPVEFGDAPIGVSKSQIVTIEVLGEEPIELDFIEVYSPFSFTTPPDLPLTLEPGKPYQLEVQVVPEVLGEISSQLQIISADLAGPNFRGINMHANGTGALAVQSSEDFTYYCASRLPERRTTTIRNRGGAPINITGANAFGATLASGLPITVPGLATATVEYDFDPASGLTPQQLLFEYTSEGGSTIYDTVIATPVEAVIWYPQTARPEENQIDVSSAFDFTSFAKTDLDINITVRSPDVVEIVRDSISLNQALLPGATFDLAESTPGNYVLTIHAVSPIAFDPMIELDEQMLFTYRPRIFVASESATHISVDGSDESCVRYLADSVIVNRAEFCADDFIQSMLAENLASNIQLFPNPAIGDELNLLFDAAVRAQIMIDLISVDGQRIRSLATDATPGRNELTINVAAMPEGTYLIQLRSPLGTLQRKFVIER